MRLFALLEKNSLLNSLLSGISRLFLLGIKWRVLDNFPGERYQVTGRNHSLDAEAYEPLRSRKIPDCLFIPEDLSRAGELQRVSGIEIEEQQSGS